MSQDQRFLSTEERRRRQAWSEAILSPRPLSKNTMKNRVLGSLRRSGVSLSLSFGETIILPLAAKEQEMCHLLRTGRGHFNKGDFTYAKSRQLFDFFYHHGHRHFRLGYGALAAW